MAPRWPNFSRPSKPEGLSVWHLWWLNPAAVLSILLLATGLSAYLIPDATYQENWGTPKFLGLPEFAYIVYAVLAFGAGGLFINLVSNRLVYRDPEKVFNQLYLPWNALRILFNATFIIILVAYAIWLLLLMAKGLSISTLFACLIGQAGASFDVRDQGDTLPGVTTLVQLEMGFAIIGVILGFRFGWKKNRWTILFPLLVVLCVAWIRSKLWSERLAVIELLVPTVVLSVRLCGSEKWKTWKRSLTAVAPVAAPPLLFIFFSIAEYSRSWSSYGESSSDSFLLFSFTRLIGYYVTALNNGAAWVQAVHHYNVPFYTLDWFWRFPLVKAWMPYESVGNASPMTDYENILTNMANPEFNNPSGIFIVRLDYGYTGGLFAWFGLGIVAMLLYRSFIKGTLLGLLMYPFFFIGLLESPRVFYWSLSRCFPTWALLFFVLFLVLFTSQVVRRRVRMRHGLIVPPEPVLDPVR